VRPEEERSAGGKDVLRQTPRNSLASRTRGGCDEPGHFCHSATPLATITWRRAHAGPQSMREIRTIMASLRGARKGLCCTAYSCTRTKGFPCLPETVYYVHFDAENQRGQCQGSVGLYVGTGKATSSVSITRLDSRASSTPPLRPGHIGDVNYSKSHDDRMEAGSSPPFSISREFHCFLDMM